MHKIMVTLVVLSLIVISSCRSTEHTRPITTSTSEQTVSIQPSDIPVPTTQPSVTDTSKSDEPSTTDNPDDLAFQKYIDFVNSEQLGDLAFKWKEDLDEDGVDEIILAYGSIGDRFDSEITKVFILHDRNREITQSGDTTC